MEKVSRFACSILKVHASLQSKSVDSDGEVSSQIFKDSFGDFNFAPDGKTLAIIRNKDKITSLADVGIYDPQKDKFQSLFDWDTNAARVVFLRGWKVSRCCSRGLYAKLRIGSCQQ